MRKIFTFLLALVASIGLSWAGELTVADGTKSNNCVPYDGYSGDYFQRVQIIYPQSELAAMAGKDITSLTFYVNSQASSALGVKVQIGLAEISDSDFSAGKDYKSATLTIVKAEDVWDLNAETVVVEFSKPFRYSGEGNILFDLQTVAKGGYGNTSFYGVGSIANYQSAYSYAESSIPATSSNRYKFIPKTTFTYEEPAPTTYTLQLVADPEKGSVAVTNLLGSDIIDNGNGNYTVPENAEVTILATPLEGYEFTGWKAGDISCDFLDCGVALNTLDNPMTIGIGRDVALMAEFAAVAPEPEPQPGEPVDVTIGSWDFENHGDDGDLILYSPDSTIRFYFDLIYGQDASDLILGKEYTVGDVYVDQDGQYAGIYTNGDWDYGIKSLSLIKTIDADQHVHFVGSVVDIIDRAFTFHYDEEAAPTPEPEPGDGPKVQLAEFAVPTEWTIFDEDPFTVDLLTGFVEIPEEVALTLSAPATGNVAIGYAFTGEGEFKYVYFANGELQGSNTKAFDWGDIKLMVSYSNYKLYYPVSYTPAPEQGGDTPTAVSNTTVTEKATKRIANGMILIEKDGVIYNVLGARVK